MISFIQKKKDFFIIYTNEYLTRDNNVYDCFYNLFQLLLLLCFMIDDTCVDVLCSASSVDRFFVCGVGVHVQFYNE